MSRFSRPLLLSIALAGTGACEPERPPPLVKSAKFGVFFGGQIQERRDIPFELDRTRQSQGFRLDFSAPLASDLSITWKLTVPEAPSPAHKKTARDAPAAPERSRSLSGVDTARAGATRFEHETPFEPGDPLGLWNVRVVLDGKVVIDRPVEVYDATARARMAAAADGGL